MSRVIIRCVGCGREYHKDECTKIYRGQKNYGFVCPHCEAEAHKREQSRVATNKATDKATANFYTLKMSVKKPSADVVGWLESLGYAPKYDNFGNADFNGNEVQGFQSITKVLASFNKRFDEPMNYKVHCRDNRGNEIDLKDIELVRLFSKYKGYEKVLAVLEEE